MLQHPPFRSLLEFNALYTLVLGSLGVFSIEFLRGVAGMDPSIVLILSALAFLGALATLPFCGRVLDSIGSKPVMRLAVAGMAAVIAGWFLTASGVIPAVVGTVAVLNLATGAAGASFNVANARVVMATMPEMGRNHFFALFSVITSLGLGSAPIVWGLALDALGTFEIVTGALTWKRHSIYFLALLLLALASLALVNRLDESGSQRPPRPDLLYARLRRWLSNWHR
jgi:MFS family permease